MTTVGAGSVAATSDFADPGTWPLPDRAHVPGKNERPGPEFARNIHAHAPAPGEPLPAMTPLWCYGLRLHKEGFFFEAHEALEPVWMAAAPNSRERALARGVIQAANAALKVRMGWPQAARRLETLARACFDDAFAGTEGSVLGLSRSEAEALLDKGMFDNAI